MPADAKLKMRNVGKYVYRINLLYICYCYNVGMYFVHVHVSNQPP